MIKWQTLGSSAPADFIYSNKKGSWNETKAAAEKSYRQKKEVFILKRGDFSLHHHNRSSRKLWLFTDSLTKQNILFYTHLPIQIVSESTRINTKKVFYIYFQMMHFSTSYYKQISKVFQFSCLAQLSPTEFKTSLLCE